MANFVFGFEQDKNGVPAGFDREVAIRAGKVHIRADAVEGLAGLLKQSYAERDRGSVRLMGEQVLEPIRTLSRYKAWTSEFFMPRSYAPGQDNKIPLYSPIGAAFLSSPGGRAEYSTPGLQRYTRPTWTRVQSSLFMPWDILEYAQWNLLGRALEETADAMAQKRDELAKPVLDAAILAASHNTTCSTVWTKASIDYIVKQSAGIGFPITHYAINPARRGEMSDWTNGSSTALPVFFSPENAREQVYQQLYYSGYLGLRCFESKDIPVSMIYLAGDPAETGYAQDHGQARSASEMQVENHGDFHSFWEDAAYYIGNQWNVWSIQVV